MTQIMLSDGCMFDPFDPESTLPSVRVFCHALAQLNRYTGHTLRPYSVAEHSCYLATSDEVINQRLVRTALIHDFGEAITNDIPRPFKKALPEYCAFENKIQRRIFEHFEEPWENLEVLHDLDVRMCANEMDVLFMNPPEFDFCPLSVEISPVERPWVHWRTSLYRLCTQHGVEDK